MDRKHKFKRMSGDEWNTTQWIDMEDEHFMVWNQMESFTTFIKIWGRIDTKLNAEETYYLTIYNNYDVSRWNGKKYVYFSEASDFGGTDTMLALLFFSAAGMVLIICGVFTVMYF